MKNKEVIKKIVFVFLSLFILFILTSSVLSADIAYIYKQSYRVDKNILKTFNESGLSVDIIQEKKIPKTDFSKYRALFVGDERFSNPSLIPINKMPSIISNYYHGEAFGITDSDGISKIAATSPLAVKKGSQILQVYTLAKEGGVFIPYYYLANGNKVQGMQRVAEVSVGQDGQDLGDVITYSSPGMMLLNGKKAEASLCFFGITKTKFWTSNAKNLFKDCVSFIASVCSFDSQCPADTNSSSYCIGNEVYINATDFMCNNPGKPTSQCTSQVKPVLIEECATSCSNGECLPQPISCNVNSDCGTNGFIGQQFCSSDNVARNFINFTCNNPGTSQSFCSNSSSIKTIEICQDYCDNGQCKNFICETNADCNDNNSSTTDICNNPSTPNAFCTNTPIPPQPIECSTNTECNDFNPLTFDECINPGTPASDCRNTLINCAQNSDCGFTGFLGTEYCSLDEIVKNYQTALCNNPGTTNSSCSLQIAPRLITQCPLACSNGQCIICNSNQDCNDNNPSTQDICNNPGTSQSFCSHTETPQPISCNVNSDCGISGFIGQQFCSADNVARNFINFTCNNPGTSQSFCSNSSSIKTIEICQDYCDNGQCKNFICETNADCNDNNSSTTDICHHPGTTQSFCSNTQIPPQQIECNSNLDCGNPSFIGQQFCSANNVAQNYLNFTCHHPGTPSSFCINSTIPLIKQQCTDYCDNGQCKNFICETNADCNDNNSSTTDICHHPGTTQSFCTNTPIPPQPIECSTNTECNDFNPLTFDECINPGTPASDCRNTLINCAQNSDCGTNGFIGNEFCSANNVKKNFQSFTCNNPGTPSSFCTLTVNQTNIQQCTDYCDNGQCKNFICETNQDCNDGDPLTIDVCHNPATSNSFCSNTPSQNITCSSNSDCGLPIFISQNFCASNNVTRLEKVFTCNNPGTSQSFCSNLINLKTIHRCSNICVNDHCAIITCSSNSQCNDNNSTTLDICNNPGTEQSFCTNTPIDITCNADSDCGTNGLIGNNICLNKNITGLFQSFKCLAPGTPSSFCTSTITQITLQQCPLACSNSQCIICNSNQDCNDNNSSTIDNCHNPGTPSSFCTNDKNVTAVCGNGILESGEECDDGNLINEDGCSSQCNIVPTEESLACRIAGSCAPSEKKIIQLSSSTNAHASLSGYPLSLCCSANFALTTTCQQDKNDALMRLSSSTNSHVSQSNPLYPIEICLSSPSKQISCRYTSQCSQSESCLISLSGLSNAHIAACAHYNTKLCCSVQ